MNVIKTTTLRNNLADALKQVSSNKNYLLVSKRGKITTAIVDIDLFEDLLSANNNEYLRSIEKAREEYRRGEAFTHEEVFGEI